MTAPFYSNKIQHFEKNKKGNDYVVGDIHGRYELVEKALKKINFNKNQDRLFCVGDLIDRGKNSAQVLNFLRNPYVHAIRGNHEDMLLELYAGAVEPSYEDLLSYADSIGLHWWLSVNKKERLEILEELRRLPLVSEIVTDRGNVGLVHADVPIGLSWIKFKEAINEGDENVIIKALWGRTRLSYGIVEEVQDIGRIYVGHTVQSKIRKLGNVVAIDTGAVFNQQLTLVNIECRTKQINEAKRPFGNIQIIKHDEKIFLPFSSYNDLNLV